MPVQTEAVTSMLRAASMHNNMPLQVDDDVSQDDIKTAYRQLAKYCHPDVNDDGHDLCILLNEVILLQWEPPSTVLPCVLTLTQAQ